MALPQQWSSRLSGYGHRRVAQKLMGHQDVGDRHDSVAGHTFLDRDLGQVPDDPCHHDE